MVTWMLILLLFIVVENVYFYRYFKNMICGLINVVVGGAMRWKEPISFREQIQQIIIRQQPAGETDRCETDNICSAAQQTHTLTHGEYLTLLYHDIYNSTVNS